MREWTFLTNHAQVFLRIAENPHSTAREIAETVGITERAVQRIIGDLETGGYIRKYRQGRCNSYELSPDRPMRHPQQKGHAVRELLDLLNR